MAQPVPGRVWLCSIFGSTEVHLINPGVCMFVGEGCSGVQVSMCVLTRSRRSDAGRAQLPNQILVLWHALELWSVPVRGAEPC